jgi:hypothetical protein
MLQMVSVRLDSNLVGDLRRLATERGVTVSQLLREGAVLVVTSGSMVPYRVKTGPMQGVGVSVSHAWVATGSGAVNRDVA